MPAETMRRWHQRTFPRSTTPTRIRIIAEFNVLTMKQADVGEDYHKMTKGAALGSDCAACFLLIDAQKELRAKQ